MHGWFEDRGRKRNIYINRDAYILLALLYLFSLLGAKFQTIIYIREELGFAIIYPHF